MTTMLILAAISPVTVTSVAIFIAVTAVAWVVIGRVSGDDKPRAEARLEMMKNRRAGGGEESAGDKQRKKNEALAAVLEKATSPLADTVSGNEKEMGQLPRAAGQRRLPPRIGTGCVQRHAVDPGWRGTVHRRCLRHALGRH